ncbi:hemagglutinin repeat-containing protein [Mannheimia granulomatis]|uniref:two-partner secretion domain-containing protein n=1 Tax=Mannheimia granulomatis TaxID=85402 RepID=UPI001405033E|nr:hemagglutinin repeat-containing protein [Mannheimia granulomatis]
MNKQCFRVIFSKTLQRLVVVSELAKSEGKSTESSSSGQILQKICKIRPLVFSLFCALGFVSFSENVFADLIIQADSSASKNQQPIILQTANGLPQVNIQTPNDKGLSHNKYSQFDVAEKGAILNNSRTTTQTQQAGLVQGNPYLARGEAKVILNEVNSNKPSVMKGYVEVAGKKADVIIANPSGLHCEGCGIINSDRATFTTGKPEIKNGQVDNFKVEAGKVKVSSKGLDNSRVDYTEILAREAEVNAGIWSKKETKVITGKNTVKRSETDKNLQIINTKQPLAGETKPQVAIDVGELGGMYSGKIHLIGTEKGVGVRNAGHIGASSETLQIDSQGRIVNTGTLNAAKPVILTASQGIENKGKIENRQGDITFNTLADIKQDGSIVARAGNIYKTANQAITQNGETVAKDNITYKSPKVVASTQSLIAAGIDVKDTAQGEVRSLEKASAKTITVATTGKATLQGKNIASGNIKISASEANLDNSHTSAYSINATASQGKIQANNATVIANKDLTLATPTLLETKDSYLKAERITTKQRSLNTQNAILEQTGTGELTIKVVDRLQNQGGTFKTQGDLDIKANGVDNQQGRLLANGKLTVNTGKGKVDSINGTMLSNQSLSITSGELINDGGLIQSNQNVTINTQGQALSNKRTLTDTQDKGIVALGALNIQTANVANKQGRIVSAGKQALNITNIDNQQGLVYAQQDLTLSGTNLANNKGNIRSGTQANITLLANLNQQNGTIQAQELNLTANTLNSITQSLIFADSLNITTSTELSNKDSRIISKFDGNIKTGSKLDNTNSTIGSQKLSLTIDTNNHRLESKKGNIVAAQNININSGIIENNQGLISANEVILNSNNHSINNQDTLLENQDNRGIIAQHSLTLNTGSLNNNNGNILSRKNSTINTTSLVNNQGEIRTQSQINLNTNTLSQNSGLITANIVNLVADFIKSSKQSEISGNQVNVAAQTLNNQESKLIAQHLANIDVNQGIQNQNGVLASLGERLTINSYQSDLNNVKGIISAQNGTLSLDTNTLNNQQGAIRAKTAGITTLQTLDNRNTPSDKHQGIVVTDLTLNAKQLDNQGGRVAVLNHAKLQVSDIQNQLGEILVVNDGLLNANKINNQAGQIVSTSANLTITTQTTLNNQQGIIGAENKLTLTTKGLLNQQGNITSSNQLVLNTAQQQIDNQYGLIFSKNQASIRSGEMNNQNGLIRADNSLLINTNQNVIDNRNTQDVAKGIIGLGSVILQGVSNLLNQQGKLYGENILNITTVGSTQNQQGIIQSNGNLTLSTKALDNQEGKISSSISNITAQTINNRAISDKGSLIYADKLTLNTEQINNQGTKAEGNTPKQGIQGKDITLETSLLNNQQGGVYSSNNVSITSNNLLNNQEGELLAVNTVNVLNSGNLTINNDKGLIQGNKTLDLNAKSLESEGSIRTKGNLNITLKDSFVLNNAFEAGNLVFKTKGDFTNNAEQTITNKMTISANNIVNNANAELSSNETTLNSNTLTNRGLIDGVKTLINSTTVTNIGTGKIYGDHLAFNSSTVENLTETIDGEAKAGTIAARERLDFGVGKLINRDHALVLSLDKLSIGGQLDENHHAIGKATLVDNGSATIESLGDGKINTAHLLNQDLYVKTGIDTKVERIVEHALGNNSNRYREGRDGYYNINNGSRNPNSYFQLNNGTRIEGFGWYSWFYNQTTNTTTLEYTDPAKISIGGSLRLDGEDLHNKYSHLLVGKQLWLGDVVFKENTQNSSLDSGKVKLNNEDIRGEINRNDKGEYRIEYRVRKKKGRKGHSHYHYNGLKYGPYDHPTEHFSFNRVLNTIGIPITSDATVDDKTKVKDIQLDTVSVVSNNADKPTAVSIGKTQLNSSIGVNTEITLTPTIDNHNIISSGQVVAKLQTTVEKFDAEYVSNMTMPMVKTHLPDVRLPQASLYKINPDATNGYLVETDPKFTDRKQWLSSDYMFEQLRHNFDNVHKRLGDGFYEQRLINEQINQLTGRRFIQGYSNDLEQYQALMNSGVKYAKQFNLSVGVGLTAKQMSELTTDMVWLVNKEITLADGRKVTAFVPQVYLVARNSDITSRGAVISANKIIGSADKVENSGVIAGLDLTRLHSNQLENRGTVLGNAVDLSAKQNLINLGGKIEAVKDLSLYAGKHLEISSTLSSSQSADGNFARTVLDQLASVKVTGEGGRLALHSDDNLTIKAANIESQGTLNAMADNALQITTLNISNKEHYNGNADNYYRLEQQGEIGSTLKGKDGVRLVGMENAILRQATVSSENGDTFIGSKGDVRIESGVQSEQLASSSKGSTKGLFSKTTETRRHYHDTTEHIGSEIDGKNVTLYSETGKVDIHGSAAVADKQLLIDGKAGVNITSATNTHYAEDEHIKTKSGLMGTGGIGFSVGKKKEQIEQDRTQQSAARSHVGSLSGDTIIRTDGHYQQTGSIVTSRDGDVDITAKSANITAARSDYESNYKRTMEQKGVTIAVSSPVTNAIQAVEKTVNSAKSVGSSKNDRINALGAVNAGFEAMRTAEQVGKLAEAMGQNPTQALSQDVSVSITYGEQKSVETQHSEGNKSEKSQINAGGKLNIKTEGGGKDSNLTIAGSDVSGKGGTHLKAEGDVNILAVDENHLERSKNKSSGFNAGVAVQFGGAGSATLGVTAGGNVAKGYGNGESRAWVGSQVGSQSSKTEIESGNTANVIGSQVQGKRVEVKAQDLNVQSSQDTMTYKGKQESASAQVTVGYGASGSAGYSKSKMTANYASVKQQAGIFAGDEGYDIDVKQHTELTGGLVTSTEKAEMEGKNRFATGTLNTTNLDNHADYKGSAMSANVAGDYKGGWNGQRVDKEGNPTHSLSNVMGYGSDKDSQSSQTTSGINSQNLIIRNEQAQLEKTGKTAEQIREEVKTSTTTDNAESRSGKLENRFDKDKLQKELDYQVKAITDFQTITMATINEKVASQAESKRAEAEQAKAEGNTIKAQELENEAKKWETGGAYRQGVDAITNAVGLALGGSPTAGVIAGAASPYINTEIKQATEGNEQANLIAHAIWGAVEAYTQGGKAGTGAVAAVTGEVGADIIARNLFGKKPENLTEAEKRTVSELSQVAAGLAGGLTSSSGNSLSIVQAVKTGQRIGKNAVENNYLSKQDWIDYKREVTSCGNNQECIEKVKEEFTDVNKANSETLKAACRLGGNTEECAKQTSLAKEGFDYARDNVRFDGSGWMAKIMNTNKAEAKIKPTEGLLGSEAITQIENALSNPEIRNKVENDPLIKRELTKGIDQAASAVRAEKTNAYEFSAKFEYPNISGLSNDYRVFGRELGAEPVFPEYYLYTAFGVGKLGKTLFDLSSTSTRVIVGANGAVSAGAQYLTNGQVSVKETLKDMSEAYITKGFGFKGYTAWNLGTGFLDGGLENAKWQDGKLQGFSIENGLEKAGVKTATSTFGYVFGKGVEGTLNKNINTYGNSLRTEPIRVGSPISRYVELSPIPVGVGNAVDSISNKFSENEYEKFKLLNGVEK